MTTDRCSLDGPGPVGHGLPAARVALLAAVARSEASGTSVGVMHLDIDRFRRVNNQHGQVVGDVVLATIASRIDGQLHGGALRFGLGGNGFVVVVTGLDEAATMALATMLVDTIKIPIMIESLSIAVQASAGVAWQKPGDESVDLVERAFLACRRAKDTAPGTVVGYETGLGSEADRRQQIEEDLRRAIHRNELVLYVQPEVSCVSGEIVGVEALVRWQHPVDGLLAPAAFLPDAEAAGLMVELGDWVLDQAIALGARWCHLRDGRPLRVWVNLAAQQLEHGEHLIARTQRALDLGEITVDCLGFEVTESSLLQDLPGAVGILGSLRQQGFEIALDDFGTGYSSLTYLRQLPVTGVKIDRQFVAGIQGGSTSSLADEAIVEAVIELSHALGLWVVAEGVETADQAARLVLLGSDYYQGFHFGRPSAPAEFERNTVQPSSDETTPFTAAVELADVAPVLPGTISARSRLFLAALDAAHDSIILTAAGALNPAEQPIVYVNAAFQAESGFAPHEVIGRSIDILFADPADPELRTWLATVDSNETSPTLEIANRRADGSIFMCEMTVSRVSDERGFRTHWLHVRRDLTQRRAAEDENARFQGLIEQTNAMVFVAETGGQWLYANQRIRRLLGIPLDSNLDGVNSSTTLPESLLELFDNEMVPELNATGNWVGKVQLPDTESHDVLDLLLELKMTLDPLRPGTQVFSAVLRDITAMQRLERAEQRRVELDRFSANLAQRALGQPAEYFLTGIGESLQALGEMLGADLVYLDAIDAAGGVLRPLGGYRRHELLAGTPDPVEVALDRLPLWIDHLTATAFFVTSSVAELGETAPWRAELANVFPPQPTGHNAYASLHVDGALIGVLGVASATVGTTWTEEELTVIRAAADTLAHQLARQRSTEVLRVSEERHTAMLARVTDMLVVIDRSGHISYANRSIGDSLGHQAESLLGRHFLALVHPGDRSKAATRFAASVQDQALLAEDLRVIRSDGSEIWCVVDTTGVFDPVVGGYMVSLRDVTAVRANAAAAERAALHDGLIVGLSRWALTVESDDLIDGLNHHLEQLGRLLCTDTAFAALINGDVVRNVAGWSKSGNRNQIEFPAASNAVPAIVARYRTLTPLIVDDILDHSEPWADEWRRFPVADRSGLNVPLVWEGKCLGNLGAAMTTTPRQWTADEVGLVERFAATVSVLLAQLQTEASLRVSRSRLNALLDASPDLIVVVDSGGLITYANRTLMRALHFPLDDVIGGHMAAILHPDDLALASQLLRSLNRNEVVPPPLLRLVRANGTFGWWEITTGPAGELIGGGRLLTCRDVTERVRADTRAATKMELLRYSFDLAQLALDKDSEAFLFELPNVCAGIGGLLGVDTVYIDRIDETAAVLTNLAGWSVDVGLLGMESYESVPLHQLQSWIERLHGPDPVVVVDERCAGIAVAMSSAGSVFGVLGVGMKTTAREWTDDEVTFVRTMAETIAHTLERARLDEALRASESRFRLLSDTAADVVLVADVDGTVTYASPSARGLLGFSPAALVGTEAFSHVHRDDLDVGARQLERLLEEGVAIAQLRLLRADGTEVWVTNSTSVVYDAETGVAVEYRMSLHDITELKQLEQQLEWQALHDPLTGLGNRTLLRRHLDLAVARRQRPNDVTVLNIDLDGFKEVNDTHGHAIGDDVLRTMARRFEALTRPTDTLARTGGDEFVLLCPETDADGGLALARRIIAAACAPLTIGSITTTLGASIGVACQHDSDADPEALLIEADRAMYDAKRAERGTARVSNARYLRSGSGAE